MFDRIDAAYANGHVTEMVFPGGLDQALRWAREKAAALGSPIELRAHLAPGRPSYLCTVEPRPEPA